jgi:hypothetical protein
MVQAWAVGICRSGCGREAARWLRAHSHQRARERDVAEDRQEALKHNSIRDGRRRDVAEDHQEALKRNSLR